MDFKVLEYTLPHCKLDTTIQKLDKLMAMIKDNQLIHTRTVSKATEKIIAKPTPGPGVQVSLGHAPHILVKQTY